MDNKELRRYLNVIKRSVALIEAGLDNDDGGLLEQLVAEQAPVCQSEVIEHPPAMPIPVAEPVQPEQPEKPQPPNEHRQKHIQSLLDIDCWPEAVPEFLATKEISDDDQVKRANAVLDQMIDRPIEGKTFLDFGCGAGWITQEIVKRGVSEAVGYDIEVDVYWNRRENAKFTTEYADLPKNHFDFIMLYDVLDHCTDPVDVMSKVQACLKEDGTVLVRCHPWTAKHSTHLYKQGVNKAYWHLFLKWEEIGTLIDDDPMFTRPEANPMEAYYWWFNDFNIEKERPMNEPVSQFFYVPAFKELLSHEQGVPMDQIDDYLARMELQFVDFVLGTK